MAVDGKKLRAFVAQYESLEGTRKAAQDDQNEVLRQAEEDGYNKKLLKRLIRELRRDAAEAQAEADLYDIYKEAYLSFESTPLGAVAAKTDKAA